MLKVQRAARRSAGLLLLLLAACSSAQEPAPPTSAPPPATIAAPTSAPPPAPTAAATISGAPRPATQLTLRAVQSSGKVFGLEELEVESDGVVANPFDPAQSDLSVRFTPDAGAAIVVPAFAYQDFDPATLAPRGGLVWRVRFTPTQAGVWQAQAELANPAIKSAPLAFNVAPNPAAQGFIRINKQNPRYLAFDDGTFYFPIGLNLGWATQPGLGVLADYQRWLDGLSQNGGNIGRVWMASWSFGIEWNDTGLGDYTKRMQQAWLLDQVFKMAEQRGVYLMLTLINHGAFSAKVNPEWQQNPYNAANGGPLKQPEDFATDVQARALFERRVRYIAARWGASPNLFAWEWWNEVNWTPIDDTRLKPWIAALTTYIHQYDPNHHLVSSSYASGGSTRLWKMPELSFAQEHDYSGSNLAKQLPKTFSTFAANAPNKPVLLAELGSSAAGADDAIKSDAIHFHNGLWAAPFSGFAGTGMYWWWDTFIDPNNLWGEFRGVSAFFKDEDLTALAPAKAQIEPADAPAFGFATALSLQSDTHALVWIHSDAYEVSEASFAYQKAQNANQLTPDWKYQLPLRSNGKLTVTGLADGDYTARWFSPQTAVWLAEQPVQVRAGVAALAVPPFDRDLALKIVR